MTNVYIKPRVAILKERLLALAKLDAESVFKKDVEYGHSWRKRGGVGAFFVIARKWDRLEERVQHGYVVTPTLAGEQLLTQYDLFGHITADNREEGIIDDVRDLRRYLLLVEEEMMERGVLRDVLEHILSSSKNQDNGSVGNGVAGRTEHTRPFGYEPEQDDSPQGGRAL